MLQLFDSYTSLFKAWRVVRYEQEGDTHMLQVVARLQDNSRLDLRDYFFADGRRKYAYQWTNTDGTLRQRWDNAPHWPSIATAPHHTHLPNQNTPEPSVITNIEDLLRFIQMWFDEQYNEGN
ncbi:MAG: hypothetical protein KKD28_11760 [Chloroflexi bacterium]|nr:hypothetical protein [Chloroflexota bacterium]MBU1662133.1 hypothetical protein [Chloroflexota bacterium]